jgi:MFS family permease
MKANQTKFFAPQHEYDRQFQLSMVIISWVVVIWGFTPNLLKFVNGEMPPPPFILHLHAIVFFGWLILYTIQSLLIRNKQLDAHRKLGKFTAYWAVLIVGFGIATAIIMNQYKFDNGRAHEIAFIAVPFVDMLTFPILIVAALLNIKDPSAHKRLMLIATIELLGAGFGRALGPIFGPFFGRMLGDNMFSFWLSVFLGGYIMVTIAMLYDFATRKQIHKIYLIVMPLIICMHLICAYLFKAPFWPPIVLQIIGR